MGTASFIFPFLLVLAATAGAGVWARRAVRGASDFTNAGGRLKAGVVAGALIGGFVGGTSIVGTGELAFRQGLSALWFTAGGGLAIILLGLFAGRFRRVQVETLPALLGQSYGEQARFGASLFLCAGMLIQVVAQMLSALPFVRLFWEAPLPLAAMVPVLLVLAYVWFGGFVGASVVGTLKTFFLAALLLSTGVWLAGALDGHAYVDWWQEGRLSPFTIGWTSAAAQCGAMVVGIFSTQTYLQPIFAAADARTARWGAVAAGIGIMAVGVISAWIGLYMSHIHPEIVPSQAVPQFFLMHTPPWVAGFAYAVILLSVIMTGASLVLSISTVLNRDLIQPLTRRFADDRSQLAVSRLLIIAVIGFGYAVVCVQADSFILEWTFLSMTLRGVTIFFPVLFLLLDAGRMPSRWALAAVWGGPLIALAWWLAMKHTGIDPLYAGGAWSLTMLLIGRLMRAERRSLDASRTAHHQNGVSQS